MDADNEGDGERHKRIYPPNPYPYTLIDAMLHPPAPGGEEPTEQEDERPPLRAYGPDEVARSAYDAFGLPNSRRPAEHRTDLGEWLDRQAGPKDDDEETG